MKNYDKKKFKTMTTNELKEREAQIRDTIPTFEHVIHGSLIQRAVKCGKSNCRCTKGDGHKSLYLSSFYHGQTAVDYVPFSWEPWIQEGIENYLLLHELMLELAEINLNLFKRRNKSDG
jgi:hypothetical protein